LDSNIATHDKVLALLARPNGAKAFVLYVCALGWSGGQASDGLIPAHVLPVVHGNQKLAWTLVDVGLWEHAEGGAYRIRNWALRQETSMVREIKAEAKAQASRKANCIRWHGKACGCWTRPPSTTTE
jgi:hypothetical protein